MANEAQKILHKVNKTVTKGKGLDLGCGPYKISPNAIGIDPNAGDVKADVLTHLQSLKDSSVQWVFTSHFLEHHTKAGEVLREIERVLEPGGQVMIYLPDISVYRDAAGTDPNAEHVNHWTAGSFIDFLLDHTTLSVTEVERRNTTPKGHHFTGDGNTEHPNAGDWEYSFFVRARKSS